MKPCIACGTEKPLSAFYKHPMMADGRLNKCKECCKEYARHSHREKSGDPEWVEKQRRRGRDKYHRLYGAGPNWTSPEASPEQKMRAHNAVVRAVKSGKILKPSRCGDCGDSSRRLHGHHENYYEPLAVDWLCPTCHRRRHATMPERVKPSPGTGGVNG